MRLWVKIGRLRKIRNRKAGLAQMRTLAIETSQNTGTLALFENERLLAEIELAAGQRTAASLAVGLRKLLDQHKLQAGDLGLVAVASGPGSFTGLRVGVTAAKTLAYAAGAEILGVDTLEVIAAALPDEGVPAWTVVNAQRQQVFAAQFIRRGTDLETLVATHIADSGQWLGQLSAGDRVTGPVLAQLADRLSEGVRPVAPEFWSPRAAFVGRLAIAQHAAGRRDDVWSLVPQYFRMSAAEEKMQQKKAGFHAGAQRTQGECQ
jgi:tRNA threonylcarbamoyladenosine biosynthesis protein TsaB